jgi:hypothetical protein
MGRAAAISLLGGVEAGEGKDFRLGRLVRRASHRVFHGQEHPVLDFVGAPGEREDDGSLAGGAVAHGASDDGKHIRGHVVGGRAAASDQTIRRHIIGGLCDAAFPRLLDPAGGLDYQERQTNKNDDGKKYANGDEHDLLCELDVRELELGELHGAPAFPGLQESSPFSGPLKSLDDKAGVAKIAPRLASPLFLL